MADPLCLDRETRGRLGKGGGLLISLLLIGHVSRLVVLLSPSHKFLPYGRVRPSSPSKRTLIDTSCFTSLYQEGRLSVILKVPKEDPEKEET
jgi:hypothetical protein